MYPSWTDAHGALTHFPIAMLFGAGVFELASILNKRESLRAVSFWMLVSAVATAVPSLFTGWLLYLTKFAPRPPALMELHWIAAVATSVVATGLLIWRVAARDQLAHRARTLACVVIMLIVAGAGFTGYLGGRMVFGDEAAVGSTTASNGGEKKPMNGTPTVHKVAVDPKLVARGEELFSDYKCRNCHRFKGKGATTGPDLTRAATLHDDISWQIEHLKNPQKLKPGSTMPKFDDLAPEELKALAHFLAAQR